MQLQIETFSYNSRRYGKPWLALVTFPTPQAVYTFGDWVGEPGRQGLLLLDVNAGDIFAWGQKDMRKPANSAPSFFIVPDTVTGIFTDFDSLKEAGFVRVTKKDAFLHFSAKKEQ